MSGRAIVTSPLPETKEAANEQWHLLLHRAWCRERDYDGGVRHHYLGSAFLEEMEMKWFCFMVPGKPQGKGRPRFSRKSGTAYTPSKTRDYERFIASCFYKFGGVKVVGRVVVEIIAVFPVPKSWTIGKKTDAVASNVYGKSFDLAMMYGDTIALSGRITIRTSSCISSLEKRAHRTRQPLTFERRRGSTWRIIDGRQACLKI